MSYIYQPSAATSTYTLLINPTTHYYQGNNGGDVITGNPNTWIPYSSNIPKSIYDPCPYGYRVPKDGSWIDFPKNTWTAYATSGGTSWNSSWWPATGRRSNSSAVLQLIGNTGYYWSSSMYPSYAYYSYYLYFDYNSGVGPSYSTLRSYSFSVRCIETTTKFS